MNNSELIKNTIWSSNEKNISQYIEYINRISSAIWQYVSNDGNFLEGHYDFNIDSYIRNKQINYEGKSIDQTIKEIKEYFKCIPDWSKPGTMINVIPPVNMLASAVAAMVLLYNPNIAQDTYSGYTFLSELEVIKYFSDLLSWDSDLCGGIFTFGGKGTNIYASKIALNKIDKNVLQSGCNNKYFMITTSEGHPCHIEAGNWLGIGTDNVCEIKCDHTGRIDIDEMEKVISSRLEKGELFLGVNINGGSTNDHVIDSVLQVKQTIDTLCKRYHLPYTPHLHVDSVIGWIYLFFSGYDFEKNPSGFDESILQRIKAQYDLVSEFQYADSIGIDFHKMGFCPYSSSLFVIKNKSEFQTITNKRIKTDIQTMGDYNPYNYTLELSRSAVGPISALVAIKTLGVKGFRQILYNYVLAASRFRAELGKLPSILVLNPDSFGFAVLFCVLPQKYYGLVAEKLESLNEDDLEAIRQNNIRFGQHLLNESLSRKTNVFFTSSRSFILKDNGLTLNPMKAYISSVYLDPETMSETINEIKRQIDIFQSNASDGGKYSFADNMVYERNG